MIYEYSFQSYAFITLHFYNMHSALTNYGAPFSLPCCGYGKYSQFNITIIRLPALPPRMWPLPALLAVLLTALLVLTSHYHHHPITHCHCHHATITTTLSASCITPPTWVWRRMIFAINKYQICACVIGWSFSHATK